jgi:hypothetical protein
MTAKKKITFFTMDAILNFGSILIFFIDNVRDNVILKQVQNGFICSNRPRNKYMMTARDCNTGKPVTGNTGKLAKIAIKIYRFTEGKIPVFSVKY